MAALSPNQRWLATIGATLFTLSFVGLLAGKSHIAAWWRFGDVSERDRIAAIEDHLAGLSVGTLRIAGDVFARLPDGTMKALAREDIAEFGTSSCRRETECWGRGCMYVYVQFHCGFNVRLRDGGSAAAYLGLRGKADIFHIAAAPAFKTEKGRVDDARRELCTLGFGCPRE